MKHATPATRPKILRHQLRRALMIALRTWLASFARTPSPNDMPADWHHIDNSTRVQQWYARSAK